MAHRGNHGGGRARRRTNWVNGPGSSVVVGFSGTSISSQSTIPGDAVPGSTILRVRGDFYFNLLTAAAVGDGFFGGFGVGVMTTAAVGAGTAAIPTPLTEANWDGWMFHRFFHCFSGLSGAADGAAAVAFEIDTKAMRKWADDDYVLVAVTEVIEEGMATAENAFNSRVLVALP